MNQKQYTWSVKDRKFLATILFLHFSLVMMTVSFFGLYYKSQVNDCKRVAEKLELGDWAKKEVDKLESEKKLDSIKQSYKKQGIDATEY